MRAPDAVKVFPAGVLGPDYVKALRAPLSQIPLMAVGGVDECNAAEFLAAGCVGVGVGGNLVRKDLIVCRRMGPPDGNCPCLPFGCGGIELKPVSFYDLRRICECHAPLCALRLCSGVVIRRHRLLCIVRERCPTRFVAGRDYQTGTAARLSGERSELK